MLALRQTGETIFCIVIAGFVYYRYKGKEHKKSFRKLNIYLKDVILTKTGSKSYDFYVARKGRRKGCFRPPEPPGQVVVPQHVATGKVWSEAEVSAKPGQQEKP